MIRLLKNILLILLPVIVMLSVYLAFDPFEVIYPYKSHFNDPRISYNRDYAVTETLIRNYPERRYDSFIFGNSRSLAFLCSDWQQYIDSTRTLHYAAHAESIFGIYKKFKYLSAHDMPIRNCLLVFDTWVLESTVNSPALLFIKHPTLSGDSLVDFHLTFFRAFKDMTFFTHYMIYKVTGRIPKMYKHIFADGDKIDPVTCEMIRINLDKALAEDSDRYYASKKEIFYPRDETKKSYSPPVVNKVQLQYLTEIRQILAANGTNYTVIISPNYDQKYLDRGDLAKLQEIFGAEHIYDYSGINDITRDIHNYYEASHFRPFIGRQILADIYRR